MLQFLILSSAFLQTQSSVLPKDFKWGTATAAFQIEGSYNTSGRGECIWDFFQNFPGRIYQNQTAHIADDFYNRYQQDIQIMQNLSIQNFRLSLSWTRIFPKGNISLPNLEGVEFYNNLINSLISVKITPWVTLYHWDLPQSYNNQTSQSTWLNPDMPNLFNLYADFCFKTFGDRVKNWITMNEIQSFAWNGYGMGVHAPGRCSPGFGSWCFDIGGGGNSSTEPYIVAHNAIIAHALAVRTYKEKYQKTQGGKIGMTITSAFALPYNVSSPEDWQSVEVALNFQYGWFADPLVFGRYPQEMRDRIDGGRLPEFNDTTRELVKGSYDFMGLNYYTSRYVKSNNVPGNCYINDGRFVPYSYNASGHQIGPAGESSWLYVYPPGLRGMAKWIKNRYSNPDIYIFENGASCPGEGSMPVSLAINDTFRMNYIFDHVMEMVDSILNDKVHIKGYFVWSLLDNFEWSAGYNIRFGITYVDYNNNLTRTIKDSGYMYQNLIEYLSQSKASKNLKNGFFSYTKNLISNKIS